MKSPLFTIYFLLLSVSVIAQIDFVPQVLIDINTGLDAPTSAFAADIDNDGDLDMLATSIWDNKVVWYENLDGQGDFGAQKIISNSTEAAQDAIAFDLDNDGDLDIITVQAATADSQLHWHENLDGQGTFGPQQFVFANTYSLLKVSAIDLDNDGDLDIATGGDDNHSWFENTDGVGTFGSQQELTTSSILKIRDFDYFDIDGDGDLDIISCITNPFFNQPDDISWYENLDGQGDFGPKQIVTTTVEQPRAVFASDIDGDGDMDILSASFDNSYVAWHENLDGLGTFASENVIEGFIAASDVTSSDIDGDGDQDVLVGYSNGNIKLFKNTDGNGTFDSGTLVSFMNSDVANVLTADIDGDGDLDIYSTSRTAHKVAWYENLDGQGNFGWQQPITANVEGALKVDCADLDGDGDLDMVSLSADWKDNKIAWYENLGDETFGDQQIIFLIEDLMNDFEIADMDNDGILDVIGSKNGIGPEKFWFKNDGQGNFGDLIIIDNSGVIAETIYATDLDNDGDNDLVIARSSSIQWYENLENGMNFSSAQTIDSNIFGLDGIFIADLDGDGDVDLLSAVNNSNTITWYENTDGQANFGAAQIISTQASQATDVHAADIDGDGDLDVLSSSDGTSGKLAWYENIDGAGTFGTENIITLSAQYTQEINACDLDGDGDRDIISIGTGINAQIPDVVAWYENLDGQGNFGQQHIITTDENGPSSIHCSDFNGDGNIDLTISAEVDNSIVIFENNGIYNNKFTGQIQRDADGNGCDANDPKVPDMLVGTVNSSSTATFSLDNGFYQIFVPAGIYDLRIYPPDYYDVDPELISQTFDGVGEVENVNFCLTPNASINDVSVVLIPLDEPRPGFEMNYELVIKNIGTETLNGSSTINFNDQQISFIESDVTPNSQSNNQLTFDYVDLLPFETRTIQLKFEVMQPPIVEAGDSLILTASIEPIVDDNTPKDNVYELKNEVINSFDPNDITVLEGDSILIQQVDDYLHYVIRFQNVGTTSAVNVRIESFLDSQLEPRSLEVLSSSHFMVTEASNDSNYNFIFENINLPDSTSNEPASHGYVAYRIKMDDLFINPGDVINNGAAIYFDFNEPIFTNTVMTTIVAQPDFENPIAMCQDATLFLDNTGNVSLMIDNIDNGSSDNFGIESLSLSQTQFDCSDVGATTISLTVQDAANNIATCNSNVTIIDDLPPILATQNISVDLNGLPSITIDPSQVDTGSSDNCEISTITLNPNAFETPGTYTAIFTATDVNGNISTEDVTITIINSLNTTEFLKKNLIIFPSPAQDFLTINLEGFEIISVTIYSKVGQFILESNNSIIDVGGLGSGVYYVRVLTGSGEVVKKFLKE